MDVRCVSKNKVGVVPNRERRTLLGPVGAVF